MGQSFADGRLPGNAYAPRHGDRPPAPRLAEGEIPCRPPGPAAARALETLAEVMVGPVTAREIGWSD
jgi:hypothetical protein